MSYAAVIDFADERALTGVPCFGGGKGGGGNMTENLAQRVGKLEQDVAVIKQDLATLTVRSENFATKVDIADIRTEMATMRGELKEEIASLRGELKGDIASLHGTFHEELRKAMNRQTVLLLTIIPAMLAAIAAVGAWFR